MIGILLDWLLGPKCPLCSSRVQPAERREHSYEHPQVNGQ